MKLNWYKLATECYSPCMDCGQDIRDKKVINDGINQKDFSHGVCVKCHAKQMIKFAKEGRITTQEAREKVLEYLNESLKIGDIDANKYNDVLIFFDSEIKKLNISS